MATMDCGTSKMPTSACYPARIQTHMRNQASHSSSLSHDARAIGEPIAEPIPSPRRWSPTYQPRRRTSRHYPTSLSFVPAPTLPTTELHEQSMSFPRRPAERGTFCISPFRSVRRMKEPFPLRLPKSPASASSPVFTAYDGAPSFPTKPTQSSKPPAGHSLRTWRSDQNLTSASMSAFGLLPSPPISEFRPASADLEASYFECKSDSKSERKSIQSTFAVTDTDTDTDTDTTDDDGGDVDLGQDLTEETITEDQLPYQAYRSLDRKEKLPEKRRTDVTNVHEAHSNLIRQCEESNDTISTTKKPDKVPTPVISSASLHSVKASMPATSPRPQRPRPTTVSSEASWIPSNFSYCETWLQGVPLDPLDKDDNPKEFNRRKFQIIEKDPPMPKLDIIPGPRALDEPVRFAVASKPRLVDIARQTSPAVAPPPSVVRQTVSVPMTPDQRQEEVSAFSPDTPLEPPMDMSDSGYGTRESGYSMDSYQDSKDDDIYSDPGSLTSDSVTSTVVCDRPDSALGPREPSPQPEIRSGSVSPKALPFTSRHSPGRAAHTSEEEKREKQASWDHEWTLDDHEWTLRELDYSVRDFPRNMLRLTSPVIVFLRKNDEKALLRPFRTIFPTVAENLLDCLCAALIARNYLLSLAKFHHRKPSHSSRNVPYAVDAVPAKAYSTLGIQLPSGSPGRIKGRVLGPRSTELRQDIERIVDNLLFAICGKSDNTLKSAIEVLAQVLETNFPR
ncbi:uncharacterized protein N7482_009908 [Penicillium canariense]|uniref:Uncharacterized protein n=1 Tax=Penicillium canariense TaxID=189055 RepID=A0A9W9HRS0_9EURO|nr:uncharacterized protein N7482_009908 [Penicillium canariense]KAJ5153430.1 hypothetical protein N7482_009908 [Penicillium canariense]